MHVTSRKCSPHPTDTNCVVLVLKMAAVVEILRMENIFGSNCSYFVIMYSGYNVKFI